MSVSDYIPNNTYDIAQPIHEGYFDKKLYPHIVKTKLKVEIYKYTPYTVTLLLDISDRILEYSYDCDCGANPRQTASITVKVDKNDPNWYMRRENKMHEWSDGNALHSGTWTPVLYKLTKIYTEPMTGSENKTELGFFIPTDNSYNYDSVTGEIRISLSGMSAGFTKEYGGGVTMIRQGKIIKVPVYENGVQVGVKEVDTTLPATCSIEENTNIDGEMFYSIAMGSDDNRNTSLKFLSMPVPINMAIVEGNDLTQIPYTIDLDADICVMDIFDKILEVSYLGSTPSLWIDENRILRVSTKPKVRGDLLMYYHDYQDIVISENVNYNDSGHYNYTEVYGSDNSVYGFYDEVYLDMELFPRRQLISDSSIQTAEECRERAEWENYKARYGGMTISVSLADRYIPQFIYPSLAVGSLIEYTTVDGDTNLYFLNKLSNGTEGWTMELQLFRPLYKTAEIREMQTLAIPKIFKYELINDNYSYKLRLYVRGDDVGLAVVKIYTDEGGTFAGESTDTNGTYNMEWKDKNAYKYVDIPIDKNGRYRFAAMLYSPFYEDSGLSEWCYVNVDEIVVPSVTDDPDPYPHSDMFIPTEKHNPYLITNEKNPITTGSSEKIII